MSTSSTDEPSSPDREAPPGEHTLLEIGRIARPHGLAGEVVVHLVSNRPERFEPGSILSASAAAAEPQMSRLLRVRSARSHNARLIVSFEGVTSRDEAESLRDLVLRAEPLAAPDELFAHELIGKEVVEISGERHGRVVALQANPASDLLLGESGWLVPLRFVVEASGDRIVVDVPEGLFE